jgi:hypothetical protein
MTRRDVETLMPGILPRIREQIRQRLSGENTAGRMRVGND